MSLRHRTLRLAALAVAGLTWPGPLPASERDHDALPRAVEHGEIRSLSEILDAVRDKLPGEVAGVEVERQDGGWSYEFRVIDKQGRLLDVYVDAETGRISRIKEK